MDGLYTRGTGSTNSEYEVRISRQSGDVGAASLVSVSSIRLRLMTVDETTD